MTFDEWRDNLPDSRQAKPLKIEPLKPIERAVSDWLTGDKDLAAEGSIVGHQVVADKPAFALNERRGGETLSDVILGNVEEVRVRQHDIRQKVQDLAVTVPKTIRAQLLSEQIVDGVSRLHRVETETIYAPLLNARSEDISETVTSLVARNQHREMQLENIVESIVSDVSKGSAVAPLYNVRINALFETEVEDVRSTITSLQQSFQRKTGLAAPAESSTPKVRPRALGSILKNFNPEA